MPTWIYNDGGRQEAGFRGETGDCVVRAIAIATGIPYREVYDELHDASREWNHKRRVSAQRKTRFNASPRSGVRREVYDQYLKKRGWAWVPRMGIGTGCKVHLSADELPSGPIVVRVSKHLVCCINGIIQDLHDCSRNGTRCVYGYYYKPPTVRGVAHKERS